MGVMDSLGAMGQNLGRSLTGNVMKAVLCVRDPKKLATNIKAKNEKDYADEIKDYVTAAVTDISNMDVEILTETKKRLNKKGAVMTLDELKDKTSGKGYLPIEVQYNPTSLRLSSSAGLQYDRSGEGAQTQAQIHTTVASSTLSCELLFDDTNIQDAFMLENNPVTNMSTGNVYSAVKSAIKGNFSVRDKVEGLVALFAVPEAKQVIFFWGNMCFRGEMTGAEARYTMFNKKGNPIRATVNISIRQGSKEEYKADKQYWNWAFDRAFGVLDETGMAGVPGVNNEVNGQSTASSFLNNNLLNLRL